jgi:hypothetical protein
MVRPNASFCVRPRQQDDEEIPNVVLAVSVSPCLAVTESVPAITNLRSGEGRADICTCDGVGGLVIRGSLELRFGTAIQLSVALPGVDKSTIDDSIKTEMMEAM